MEGGQRALKDQIDSLKKTNPEAAEAVEQLVTRANREAVSSLENLESSLKQGKINEEAFGRQANEVLVALNKTYQELEEALADYARGEDARFNEMLSKYGLKLTDAQRIRLKQKPEIVSDLVKAIAEARASLPPDGGKVPPKEIERIKKALWGGVKSAFNQGSAKTSEEQAKIPLRRTAENFLPKKDDIANKLYQLGFISRQERDAIKAAKNEDELVKVLVHVYLRDQNKFRLGVAIVAPGLLPSFIAAEVEAGIISKEEAGELSEQIMQQAQILKQLEQAAVEKIAEMRVELARKVEEGDAEAKEKLEKLEEKTENEEKTAEFIAEVIVETQEIMKEAREVNEEVIEKAVEEAIERLLV